MSRTFIVLSSVVALLAFVGAARAQDLGPQPATFEITINPVVDADPFPVILRRQTRKHS